MPGYDGSIRIDSRIDTKGFNKGISGMTSLMKPLMTAVAALGAAIAAAVGVKAILSVSKLSAEFQRLGIAAQAVGQLHGIAAEETRALVDELIAAGIQTDVANRAFIEFTRAGLDNGLLPALARGAQDLAVFAGEGESSSDVLNNILLGIVKLNPLILRNAGIIVDLEDSYKKMADAIGISTNELTSQQKQQAALIAVTEKLQGVTGLYELSQKTVAGQLSSNVRIMNEFKAAIGDVFQAGLYRLIKGFSDLVKVMTAAIKPGGALHDVFIRIGIAAAFVADIITSVFRLIAGLFGVDVGKAKSTASAGTGAESAAGSVSSLGDASEKAGKGQEKLAKGIDKAKKAAKGALASFDELNVLQQDTGGVDTGGADEPDAGGLDALGGFDFGAIDPSQFLDPMKEIEDGLIAFKERMAEVWGNVVEFFEPVITAIRENLLPVILELGGKVWDGLLWVWENILVPFGQWFISEFAPRIITLIARVGAAWSKMLTAIGPVWTWLWNRVLKPLAEWLGTVIIAAIDLVIWWFETLITVIDNFEPSVAALKEYFSAAWDGIVSIWQGAGEWFNGIIEQIKSGFQSGLDYIKNYFNTTFANIRDFVSGIFNSISQKIQDVINGILDSINIAIQRLQNIKLPSIGGFQMPSFGGFSAGGGSDPWIEKIKIPGLATGAVIPPNASFLAMLGDQRSGKNIEAPESMIRQILREEMGSIKAEIGIEFTGRLSALARELQPEIVKENVRLGSSLIQGGVVK